MDVRLDENGTHGCKHYNRKCLLLAPCCNKFYVCRVCHDEAEDHRINRFDVDLIKCMICGEVQRSGRVCQNKRCRDFTHPSRRTFFAQYHCKVCNLFDDSDRELYHCEHCGLCRVGSPHSNVHCHTCNICWNLSGFTHHTCKPNILKENCPVCKEYLQVSRKTTYILECGHCFHSDCLGKYFEKHLGCHRCLKQTQDISIGIDTTDKFYQAVLPSFEDKPKADSKIPLTKDLFPQMTEYLTLSDLGALTCVSKKVAHLALNPVIWKRRMRKRSGFFPFAFVHPYIQVKYQLDLTQIGASCCVALAAGDYRAVLWFLEAGINPHLFTDTMATSEWISSIPAPVRSLLETHKRKWVAAGNQPCTKRLCRPNERGDVQKRFPLPMLLSLEKSHQATTGEPFNGSVLS